MFTMEKIGVNRRGYRLATRTEEKYHLLILKTSDDAGPEFQFRVIEKKRFTELDPSAVIATVSDARQHRMEVDQVSRQDEYFGSLIELQDGHIFNGRTFPLDERYSGFKYTLIRFDK